MLCIFLAMATSALTPLIASFIGRLATIIETSTVEQVQVVLRRAFGERSPAPARRGRPPRSGLARKKARAKKAPRAARPAAEPTRRGRTKKRSPPPSRAPASAVGQAGTKVAARKQRKKRKAAPRTRVPARVVSSPPAPALAVIAPAAVEPS
jgi:hypothetical protein